MIPSLQSAGRKVTIFINLTMIPLQLGEMKLEVCDLTPLTGSINGAHLKVKMNKLTNCNIAHAVLAAASMPYRHMNNGRADLSTPFLAGQWFSPAVLTCYDNVLTCR